MAQKTIYQQAIAAMKPCEINNYQSDLYLKCSETSKKLVENYEFKNNVRSFRNQIDNSTWYDIPFSFDPFWEKAKR